MFGLAQAQIGYQLFGVTVQSVGKHLDGAAIARGVKLIAESINLRVSACDDLPVGDGHRIAMLLGTHTHGVCSCGVVYLEDPAFDIARYYPLELLRELIHEYDFDTVHALVP